MGKFLGILLAVVLHAAFLLFGGLLFPEVEPGAGHLQEVELLDPTTAPSEEQPKEPEPPPPEVETPPESPPDAADAIAKLEQPSDATPGLDAASLGAISDALVGAGGGDFAGGVSFASGGRIGGTGLGGGMEDTMDKAFSLAEIDQKPRATYQASAVYPQQMRGRRVEGVVSVIFVVDATGKVADPRPEKSSHPEFERPAVDAVKRWKFEPAIKSGKRVACKMRVTVRFQPS